MPWGRNRFAVTSRGGGTRQYRLVHHSRNLVVRNFLDTRQKTDCMGFLSKSTRILPHYQVVSNFGICHGSSRFRA
jgi:hypothetical protein